MSAPVLRRPGAGPPPAEEPAIPIEPAVARARSAMLKNAIATLRKMKAEDKTRTEMIEAVPDFNRDYPKLFSLLVDKGEFENPSLRTMIAMLDRMGSGPIPSPPMTASFMLFIYSPKLQSERVRPLFPLQLMQQVHRSQQNQQ